MNYTIRKFIRNKRILHYIFIFLKNVNNESFYKKVVVGIDKKNELRIEKFGNENYGKTIYYILIKDGTSGFFALYRSVLHALYFSDMCGFVPYIKIVETAYNNEKENLYDIFFKQPGNINEELVEKSSSVIKYVSEHRRWAEEEFCKQSTLTGGYDFDDELINRLAYISNKYITIKEDFYNKLNNEVCRLLNNKKTLGIHHRGNAYKVGFEGHPIALSIEDYFEFIDHSLRIGYEQIFVATDEISALSRFNERYENKIVYYKDVSRSNDGIDIHNHHNKMKKSGLELGYEVLRDMYTLSRCQGLVCGKSQVSFAARIEKKARNEDYEFIHIIDKGVYGKEHLKEVEKYSKRVNLR